MRAVEPLDIAERQTVPVKVWRKRKRRHKKRSILIGSLLLLFLASSTSAVAGYLIDRSYKADLALAQAGMQHLRSAATLLESLQAHPLAPQVVEQAQQEFAGALSDAQALEAGLANFTGIAGAVPVYGPRLIAAIHLSALAVDVSQAGIGGCKILEMVLARLGSPLNASTPGLTKADFTTLSSEYQTVKTSLNAAINEAVLVQPGDVSFDAHLAKLLWEFQANIPAVRSALAQEDLLLPALPALLGIGTPAHFLLEILDSTELRPGGGFIGNYGIATFTGGRLSTVHITDAYLLDKAFEYAGHSLPFPPSYQWFANYLGLSSWSLRDSNLDADFPTAARYGELNFEREGGNVPLQGVIAVTPSFIEQVLDITGPISVPEYQETVTAQNLVSLIHFHQLGQGGSDLLPSPDGLSSQRKYFTELLGEHLLARVQQLASADAAKFLGLAVGSLRTKDFQLYFNASQAENALHLLHLDGTIQSPPGDHLFVVDTNVAASKANSFIINTMQDQVSIGEHGNAVHHTTITYAWRLPGQNYGYPLYQDYVRIYAPPGSTLAKQDGWQPLGTSTAFGSQVWAGYFTLAEGQARTITLVWTNHGAVRRDANSWHYQYALQRQAGAQWAVALQVMLPSCASVTDQWGGLHSKEKQEETLAQSLTQDLSVGVDYTCR